MHAQPSQAPEPDALAHAILDLLTEERTGLWSIAELERTLTPSAAPPAPGPTADAIESLHAAGLIHRVADFVFASRAAHEAQRLAG